MRTWGSGHSQQSHVTWLSSSTTNRASWQLREWTDSVGTDASWIGISLDRCHDSNRWGGAESGDSLDPVVEHSQKLAVAASSRRKSGNSTHLSPYRIMPGLGSPEEHVQGRGRNKPPCRWPKQSDVGGSFPLVWPAENQGQLTDWKGPGDVFASSKSMRKRGKRMIQGAVGPPRPPDAGISSENVTAHRCNNLSAMRGV